jgi:hypothetical protein
MIEPRIKMDDVGNFVDDLQRGSGPELEKIHGSHTGNELAKES